MLGATHEKNYMITTKGQFMTHVNEIYLREDVSCGCAEYDEEGQKINILNIVEDDISKVVTFFDSETLISQIDLIENCPLFKNIVLLQSSVKKIKQKKPKIFTKLKHFVELDSTKNVYIFPNEYCKDTAVLQSGLGSNKEVVEMKKTLEWYKQKLTPEWIEIMLITNNFAISQAAKETGVTVKTVKDFAIQNLNKFPELQNFIGVDQTLTDLDLSPYKEIFASYEGHLPEQDLLSMIRTGALLKGRLRVSRNNINEATMMSQFGFEIKVVGEAAMNRAIHGDTVAVELLPEEQWLSAKHIDLKEENMIKDDNESEKTAETSNIEFRNLVEKIKKLELCPLAVVKGVIKRNLRNLAGQVKRTIFSEEGISYGDCQPVDPRYPNTILRLFNIDEMLDKKIMFSIDEWPSHSKLPFGHLVGVFGKADDLETESKVILFEHNVETREFSQAVLDCLPKEGKNFKITDEEVAKRQDLRGYPICSVDPPGCKDIDDALHSRTLPNGNIECGVHIADVTHFVRPDTPIDKEAAFRSTTVYLVDRRTDMLPSLLTENLCSLRGGVERLAFSCVWEMNPKTAEIINVKFHKSVIKSTNAFTYEQAQTLIDDKSKDNTTVRSLRGLMKMSKLLKKKRNKNGALTLASTQVKFKFDAETHNPTDVSYYTSFDTNSMVEEFMLLANISVARKTLEHFPGKSILRHHNPPKPLMIKEFGNLMDSLGYNFDYSSSKALAQSLDKIKKLDDPFFNRLVRIMTTRCMNEAAYICTADFDYPEYNHYGLATDVYTHFTSPIRRYADVLVHRLLAASLDIDSLPNTMCNKHNLTKLCDNMNMRHRNARFASRASSDYFSFLYFKDKKLKENAIVCGIERNGVSVILPKYGFEGFIEYSEEEIEKNRKLIEKLGKKIVTKCVIGEQQLEMFSRVNVFLRMEMKHFRKQIIITLDDGSSGDN